MKKCHGCGYEIKEMLSNERIAELLNNVDPICDDVDGDSEFIKEFLDKNNKVIYIAPVENECSNPNHIMIFLK